VQQFIEGQEFTLDVLADCGGRAICAVPRLRIETRDGEVSKGVTVRDPLLIEAGIRVAEALPGAFGPITVQCFLTAEGSMYFIEINPRFGGGFPLSAEAGANFPKWILEMILGRKSTGFDDWQDGIAMLRYDEAFFVSRECL
jgi:carbamoyl-phosphate synthase large subunit